MVIGRDGEHNKNKYMHKNESIKIPDLELSIRNFASKCTAWKKKKTLSNYCYKIIFETQTSINTHNRD